MMLQKSLSAETAEAQVRLAQRMEIVGRLTGGIVHDFNNILTVITGTIGILAEAVADRPDLAAIAGLIDQAAARGADLTGHLLAFTRGGPSQPCEVDVNALLVDATRLLRPTLGELIEIDTALASGVASVLVDPKLLMTAILNLAIMVSDAMPEGGKLTFETRNARPDEGCVDPNGDAAAEVMVAVYASGIGVSAGDPDRALFDLSRIQDLVRPTGGRVKMDSEVGRRRSEIGTSAIETSAKIYLPRATGLVHPPAEAREGMKQF